jgi:hypothetical protein
MPRKQVRRKSWFGTDNSYSLKKSSAIKNALEACPNVVRAIVSIEKGSNAKKRHYQFYIELKNGMTFTAVQKKYFSGDKAHLEKRKGTPWEAWTYCSENKDDGTHIKQLVVVGDPPDETYTKAKSVWPAIYARIEEGATMFELQREFLNSVPRYHRFINEELLKRDTKAYKNRYRPLRVEWWWGPPRTGKTREAMALVPEPRDIHRVSDYRNPWDSYDGQEYILLDEFHGQLNLAQMLQLLDDYYPELPCRYYNKVGKFHTVIIASNQSFESIYDTTPGDFDSRAGYYANREQSVAALLHRIDLTRYFGVKKITCAEDTINDDLFGLW